MRKIILLVFGIFFISSCGIDGNENIAQNMGNLNNSGVKIDNKIKTNFQILMIYGKVLKNQNFQNEKF